MANVEIITQELDYTMREWKERKEALKKFEEGEEEHKRHAREVEEAGCTGGTVKQAGSFIAREANCSSARLQQWHMRWIQQQQSREDKKRAQQSVAYLILEQIAKVYDMKVILDKQNGGNVGQIYADLHTYDEQFHLQGSALIRMRAPTPYSLTYAHKIKRDLAEKAMECAIQNYNFAKQFFGLAALDQTMPVNNNIHYYSFGTDALQWWIYKERLKNNRIAQFAVSTKSCCCLAFDIFLPSPFNMPVLITSAKVSITIDKIASIGYSYLVFLGSFSNSLCAVKVERQEGIAKREAGVLKHLTGVCRVPTRNSSIDTVYTRNVQHVGISLLDTLVKATATTAFASKEEPDTVTGIAAFMNKILMMRRGGNLPWKKYGCEVNEAVDRLDLLHEAMISLSDNDGVELFVAWAR
ncbi:15709_t:CDS:2, partial [Funneliformis caledonium]